MLGASRAALGSLVESLREQLVTGIQGQQLGEELFAAVAVLDGSGTLRRALTDPSREGEDRSGLARSLFQGKVSDQATELLGAAAALRWSDDQDFADALEQVGVRAIFSSAQFEDRVDEVEDQLFRFERVVAADSALRDAVTDRRAEPGRKADLVSNLLEGRAAPEAVQLARQAVLAPRGRRFDQVIADYLAVASQERDELTAVVTVAVPLGDDQRERLGAALSRLYGRHVLVNVVVDPDVIGGIRVETGDEVIDGTTLRKLDDARRWLTGG